MDPLLEGLNEEQKKAVLKIDGPVLILAGAGSGKTRVITHRIANLLLNHGIDRICAVTFTNKAAAEMLERVRKLVPVIPTHLQIKTFHSLCLYILRREAGFFGFDSGFTVYDTTLQESLLKQVIKDLSLDSKFYKPSMLGNYISGLKDKMLGPEAFLEKEGRTDFSKTVSAIYKEYEKRKDTNRAFDFGDLIWKTVQLFQKSPDALSKYRSRWEYVMVDEYQDTNKVQYELVHLLAGETKNLCVVGDDDQSIYSWRGADIGNILNFEKDFPNSTVIKLEENYRSSANIILAASRVISNNTQRKQKEIFTNNNSGSPVRLNEYQNETEEAHGIVSRIRSAYSSGIEYKNIAIFYRTNSQSRYFEEALRNAGIPYKIFGGFRFFDRAEIKDFIAYLNVIANPMDSVSLLRIVNYPPRGIGDSGIEKMREFSLERGTSLLEALGKEDLPLKKSAKSKGKELYNVFSDLIEKNERGGSPSEIALELLNRSGLMSHFKEEATEESVARLENLQELINSIEEYEKNSDSPSLEEYLNQISLLTSEEDGKDLTDFVNLMTVHNAKGLEFKIVFLSGLEEGTFPHSMSLEDSHHGDEEERRLFYVALTRAREELFLSFCRTSRKFGKIEDRIASRFLSELPEECFGNHSPGRERTARKPNGPPLASKIRETAEEFDTGFSEGPSPDNLYLKPGDRVKHKQFGIGTILAVSGKEKNTKVSIRFGNVEKNFFVAYTPLEKL
ncbi:AAA family ATPase [Leptospira gomenensis]|uniref:DNA 3'-5' helicase n=1 Tax=Leptospira gomenensis TaxID=2484974 RepID=A0A5F1YS55_9LEPT|nr:UvrD-helicase domain-containing protein [Leptospira gomenensis]TGK38625.1 AAA family ATPase [Leptospira gomenensis]TGK42862.1 AAA family ATPase [Leptospira gomenensis]TGK49593.1 AAA family ATPase [Leptospira gomenensis]TGK60737.1 AAA family ATPase [Leptospira gomenensis]